MTTLSGHFTQTPTKAAALAICEFFSARQAPTREPQKTVAKHPKKAQSFSYLSSYFLALYSGAIMPIFGGVILPTCKRYTSS